MAHPKRSKSTGKASQKHAQAKQAMKKKQKGAAKFRNEELRTLLDSQAATLYSINNTENSISVFQTPSAIHESVQDLTTTLENL